MNKSISLLFFSTVQEIFVFLVTEHGFRGPYSNFDSNDTLYMYSVWYVGNNLAIEFYLESRDRDVDCYISRLVNGEVPDDWAVNERGERIRMRLSEWIRASGFQEPLFTKVTNLSLEEEIPITLSDYARMLQKHGRAILEDQSGIFQHKN